MSKTQIITGVERRRKFSDEEKASIVAEAMDSTMSAVARKHGISNGLLHSWKKKFPPKSFALVEIKTSEPKEINQTIPPKSIEMIVPQGIRVIVQKRIVVEFPLTVEPGAIALFVRALEG